MALRMSQMLRSSKETRSTDSRKRSPAPAPAASVPAAPASVDFDPALKKILLVQEALLVQENLPAEAALPDESAPSVESAAKKKKGQESVAAGKPAAKPAQVYKKLVAAARHVFEAAAEKTEPHSATIIGAVRRAFKQLEQGEEVLAETVRQRRDFRAWPQRAANVAVLSMRLGIELKCDDRRCLALGLCGLMHDVGMIKIPAAVLDSPGLTPEQLELLHRHPIESHKIVQGFGPSFVWIGKIVAQAHERMDGSGYPRGLSGEQIHEVASIVGLADTYEAMAHPRPDREARATYNALKEIIDKRNTDFERRFVKALIHVVSIFPLGSLVRLNNGEIGRVIGASRSYPTRPTVEILVDPQGRRLAASRAIDLESEPMLYIVDPAIEESVLNR